MRTAFLYLPAFAIVGVSVYLSVDHDEPAGQEISSNQSTVVQNIPYNSAGVVVSAVQSKEMIDAASKLPKNISQTSRFANPENNVGRLEKDILREEIGRVDHVEQKDLPKGISQFSPSYSSNGGALEAVISGFDTDHALAAASRRTNPFTGEMLPK